MFLGVNYCISTIIMRLITKIIYTHSSVVQNTTLSKIVTLVAGTILPYFGFHNSIHSELLNSLLTLRCATYLFRHIQSPSYFVRLFKDKQ